MMPQIMIDLGKIEENARTLADLFAPMVVAGVTKAVCGDPRVARAMQAGGAKQIADSRIMNIKRMKEAGLQGRFLLLRSPMASMAEEAVRWADVSLVSSMDIISKLGSAAADMGKEHGILIMVDMGDRREGVLPSGLKELVENAAGVEGIVLEGIGTNMACYGGIIPTMEKMQELAELAETIEDATGNKIEIVSGGNSANIPLIMEEGHPLRVNHIRLGESILLGVETVGRTPVPGTFQDAFVISAELVEVREKPSVPDGRIGQDAFGDVPVFEDRGVIREGLLALGRQDMGSSSLHPSDDGVSVLGSNSDYTILEVPPEKGFSDTISFIPEYGSLLQAMTSPYVEKTYIGWVVRE